MASSLRGVLNAEGREISPVGFPSGPMILTVRGASKSYAPCLESRLIICNLGGSASASPLAGKRSATSRFAGPGIVPRSRAKSVLTGP